MVSTPIPARLGESIAIDIVYLPRVEWQSIEYDCAVVAVDRLSGWIVAIPARRQGLRAKDVAIEMFHRWWGPFGVPGVITSDQEPHFVGAWWRTLCNLQGVRVAHAAAYHHSGNGRAEAAICQVERILRHVMLDMPDSVWPEALTRVLQFIHDAPGPTGLSPYQVFFGQNHFAGGIPRELDREAPYAVEFFRKMQQMDEAIAKKMQMTCMHRD